MPNYPDPPPNFLEATSEGPNGRRLSTSTAASNAPSSVAGSAHRAALTLPDGTDGGVSASPTPSLRRWDDPPEHEPDHPAENPTTLVLVHNRRVQTFATRKEILRIEFSPNDNYLVAATTFSNSHQHPDDYMNVIAYDARSWAPVSFAQASMTRLHGDFALTERPPLVALPFFTLQEVVRDWSTRKPQVEVHDLALRKKVSKGSPMVPVQAPLAYSPDGKLLAGAGSRDPSRILILQANDMTRLRMISTHMGDVTHLGFSPDGTAIISASKDGSMRMTSLATGRTLRKVEVPPTRFNCSLMQVSPDGDLVVSVWGREVHLWHPATGDIRGYHLNAVRQTDGWPLTISPNCELLLCRTEHGFDVANVADGKFRGEFVAESTLVTAAAFTHDSKFLAVGKYTGEIHLFEVLT